MSANTRPNSSTGKASGLARSLTMRPHSSGRRVRATTSQFDSTMQHTLKNKAAAMAHLSYLDEELSRTPRARRLSMMAQRPALHASPCTRCNGSGIEPKNHDVVSSSSSSSDSEDEEWISPPPNLPEEMLAQHREEVRKIEEAEARRTSSSTSSTSTNGSLVLDTPTNYSMGDNKRASRRAYRSTNFESNGGGDASSLDYERPLASLSSSPGRRVGDMSIDSGSPSRTVSPRTLLIDRAVRMRKQQEIMQEFLAGHQCNYSWTKFQQCVHAGLSDTVREQFWTTQAMTAESSALPMLDQVLENARLPRKVYDQIMIDLHRTMPDIAAQDPYFINSLYRGLVAHAVLRPKIGYVQGMNMLWGTIIASISQPNKQLIVAEHIVRNVLPYYFTTDLLGAIIDARVLNFYLQRRCPKLKKQMLRCFSRQATLGNNAVDTNIVDMMLQRLTSTNFPDLFNTMLCSSQRKRLWDHIMLRGAVAVFEFSLRLLIYARDQHIVRNADNWVGFCVELEQHVRALTDIDPILDTPIPLGRIINEDFVARRRAATRIVFSELESATRDS